jgi:hypothetical protein
MWRRVQTAHPSGWATFTLGYLVVGSVYVTCLRQLICAAWRSGWPSRVRFRRSGHHRAVVCCSLAFVDFSTSASRTPRLSTAAAFVAVFINRTLDRQARLTLCVD